ncbi:hypothetical protein [Nocardia lijiangensis]|uniref:hypothetical protein n=1 Tax=Nocardia lijiangensis TaxID=299618 RepID=UPI000AD3C522|nr:hypothetical protein [Nocardia lijiangensis]
MSNLSADPGADGIARPDAFAVSGWGDPVDARRDRRGFIRLSVDFLENRRTGPLSPVAKLTLIGLWIYCARNRTDGIVPAAYARRTVPKRLREALTAAGCWHPLTCTTTSPCHHGTCTTAASCGQEALVMRDYGRHQPLYRNPDAPGTDHRPYLKLSVDFLENHRTGPLSPVAKLTLIELWIYCHRNRTNGIVSLAAFRKIAPSRIRDALIAAGSCRPHVCTTAAPCHHGACTTSAPCGHGVVIMHDYHRHQTTHIDPQRRREQARSAGKSGGLAKAAKTRRPASGPASGTARDPATNARASQKLEVKDVSSSVDNSPPVRNARGKNGNGAPPTPPLPPPTAAGPTVPRARHGGDDVADRLNAAAPEVPATSAMRRRVLARLVPDAVAVLADPATGPIRRAQAQAELDRAEAVIDARAEYLASGDVAENPEKDRLFDPHGDSGYARRMAAAHRPLPVPDPITAGERRALAFRLARDHLDAVSRQGANPPGGAREALRAELEALLDGGVHQDVLRAELAEMREAGLWAASKLRQRVQQVRT